MKYNINLHLFCNTKTFIFHPIVANEIQTVYNLNPIKICVYLLNLRHPRANRLYRKIPQNHQHRIFLARRLFSESYFVEWCFGEESHRKLKKNTIFAA